MNSFDNEQTPWATFCISTYKRPQYLSDQLNSILKQTFRNFSIIICDNDVEGSGEFVVTNIGDPRIIYHRNEENLGMVKSFNRCLGFAKSEFVIFVTDDDPVYPDMLEVLNDLTIKYPGKGIYFGGNDRSYVNAEMAKASNERVGVNSQLAYLNINTIRQFTGDEFLISYLNNEFGRGILWSAGIVKREIALEIGGMADYGTPNMADCAYVLLSGSRNGAVFINKSLACQAIHEDNFSFKTTNFSSFSKGVDGFYEWIKNYMPKERWNESIDKMVKDYTARVLVAFFIFTKRNFLQTKVVNPSFEECVSQSFNVSFMKKWKFKYWIGVKFPNIFSYLVSIKKIFFKEKK